MSTAFEDSIALTEQDNKDLVHFKELLGSAPASVTSSNGQPAPARLQEILARILEAASSGRTLKITQLPEEVTTTTAATMLGVSRPTVMKYIQQGKLTARMVGTHHRIKSAEVLELIEKRKTEMRSSVFGLLDKIE